jgi:deazaflavin-dependent oxidoreductase (nitroreductase family)
MARKTEKLSMLSLMLYNLSGRRLQLNTADDPVGLLVLHTIGRKSGQPRSTSLVYIKRGEAYVVAASAGGRDQHPSWFFNLRHHPHVTIQIKKQRFNVVAEIATPKQREQLWPQLVGAAPMFARYEKMTTRSIPMILLQPVP